MKKTKEIPRVPDYNISAKEYCALEPSERKKWAPIPPKYEKIPIFCIVALCIAAVSAVLYIIACLSESFADFFNIYISSAFRIVLAKITNILPFSLAEAIVILLPVIGFISIWYLLKFRCESRRSSMVSVVCILSIASLFLSSFILCFGIGYRGTTLDKKLGLDDNPVNKQELYDATLYLTEKINELSANTLYTEDGFSKMPYNFDEMNDKLIAAYDNFCEEHYFISNFSSKLKPVMLSEALSYTHITGVYSFFTGESNINVDFPDYTIPYTAAHELAHQRGIAREDEANMIAFLVCISSDDEYIRYSAYLNVYEYVANALYKADKELYKSARAKIDTAIYNEQVAYSTFFKKYSGSVASKVSGAVNDTYLKTQGTEGQVSYGMVVDLTVAYLKQQNIIE